MMRRCVHCKHPLPGAGPLAPPSAGIGEHIRVGDRLVGPLCPACARPHHPAWSLAAVVTTAEAAAAHALIRAGRQYADELEDACQVGDRVPDERIAGEIAHLRASADVLEESMVRWP